MSATPGPWSVDGVSLVVAPIADERGQYRTIADVRHNRIENAELIAAAPDHALLGWAMCVQDGRWEEWTPFDGSGEFIFAGLRYVTRLDQFGCPRLTPALREAITQAQSAPVPA